MRDTVEITLLTSNQTGMLAAIMKAGAILGLMLSKNKFEKTSEENSTGVILFNGRLKGSEQDLIDSMQALPGVNSVANVSLSYADSGLGTAATTHNTPETPKPDTSNSSAPLNTQLRSIDVISADSLKIAENKLVDSLGPVAGMLVESAASETKHIGDLFLLLAKDLDGDERKEFLSLVSGLEADM